MPDSSARARSETAVVSCSVVPGGSSRLRLLRPRSEVGMKVVGMNGTNASERSEEHTSELQSLMRSSYAVFCLNKKIYNASETNTIQVDMLRISRTLVLRS